MSKKTCNIPEWRKFEQMVARIEDDARSLGCSGLTEIAKIEYKAPGNR